MAEIWQHLDPILIESMRGLCADYGVVCEETYIDQGTYGPRSRVAVVGFGALYLRGSLAASVPDALLALSSPVTLVDEDALTDWAGEFVNQLMGRIKRRLLAHGLVVQTGIPLVVTPSDMRVAPCGESQWRARRFIAEALEAHVRIDIATDPEFQLLPARTPASEAPAEGDLLLF